MWSLVTKVFLLFQGFLLIRSSLTNQGPPKKARPVKTVEVCLYLMLFKT